MRYFDAAWNQLLENGKTSGDDVWDEALKVVLFKISKETSGDWDSFVYELEYWIKNELNARKRR